jgi:RhoGAP domain
LYLLYLHFLSPGIDVDLSTIKDVNDITGALKLYFRELPEPLLTFQLYEAFMTATAVENASDRLRCISEVLNR